jgi:hypothetical protein
LYLEAGCHHDDSLGFPELVRQLGGLFSDPLAESGALVSCGVRERTTFGFFLAVALSMRSIKQKLAKPTTCLACLRFLHPLGFSLLLLLSIVVFAVRVVFIIFAVRVVFIILAEGFVAFVLAVRVIFVVFVFSTLHIFATFSSLPPIG